MPDIEKLIQSFNSEGEKGPRAAIKALAKTGRPALRPLIDAASNSNIRTRRWAMEALAVVKGPGARAAIRKGTQDPAMSVRYHALQALLTVRDPKAPEILVTLLKDESGGIRVNAVDGLAHLGAKEAVPALRRCLKDPKNYVRRAAEKALERLEEST